MKFWGHSFHAFRAPLRSLIEIPRLDLSSLPNSSSSRIHFIVIEQALRHMVFKFLLSFPKALFLFSGQKLSSYYIFGLPKKSNCHKIYAFETQLFCEGFLHQHASMNFPQAFPSEAKCSLSLSFHLPRCGRSQSNIQPPISLPKEGRSHLIQAPMTSEQQIWNEEEEGYKKILWKRGRTFFILMMSQTQLVWFTVSLCRNF